MNTEEGVARVRVVPAEDFICVCCKVGCCPDLAR